MLRKVNQYVNKAVKRKGRNKRSYSAKEKIKFYVVVWKKILNYIKYALPGPSTHAEKSSE